MKTIWKVLIIILAIIIISALAFLIYMQTTYLSKDEIKDIVIEDMNQNENDIYFESIEFEFDEKIYEVHVYYNNVEYDYKIDGKNGRIIYTDYVNSSNNSANTQNNENSTTNTDTSSSSDNTTTAITLDEAKQIAYDYANVNESDINLKKAKEEVNNRVSVYEIEFTDTTYEYEIKINKNTGEIISYEKDNLNH